MAESGDEKFTQIPSMPNTQNNNRNTFYHYSEVLVERGDHVRLQDIKVSYDFIRKDFSKLPFTKIQFYLYANNIGVLWKVTDLDLDPDYAKSLSPPMRTIFCGFKNSFLKIEL